MAATESMRSILQSGASILAADTFRLGIVYVHLIACCVAIGLVFTSDITFVTQLLKGDSRQDPEHLTVLQKTVSVALITLWITGIAIVLLDALLSDWSYFLNPKIQAKVVIVCLLTLNGMVLHHAVLPALKKAGALLDLAVSQRLLAIFAGSVSAISWFYAAMLGIGRPLNWKYTLQELLAMYPVFILGGCLMMLLLTGWAGYKSRRGSSNGSNSWVERREPV